MVKYGFFNSIRQIDGKHDREYDENDVNAYFKGAISSDGIFQLIGNQCHVISAGNMNVAVRDGRGLINYHYFEVTSNEVLTINKAHSTFDRWTAVVARYDAANRNIYIMTIDGVASNKPVKPTLQKSDALRDICLAYVYVKAKATQITNKNIIDTVEDKKVCGFVSTLVPGVDVIKRVNPLPTPSETCQGSIYYLTDKCIIDSETYERGYYHCEWASDESKYKWFPIGSGIYATIEISYPSGMTIQVTFEGNTIESPDTSGEWSYYCYKEGTYIIGIKGTSDTQEVNITSFNQVKNIEFENQQKINYALLYYRGNEFANPTTEEQQYAIATGGWEVYNNTTLQCAGYKTVNNINLNEYDYIFLSGYIKRQRTEGSFTGLAIGTDYVNSNSNVFLENELIITENTDDDESFNFKGSSISNIQSTLPIMFAVCNKATLGIDDSFDNESSPYSLYVIVSEISEPNPVICAYIHLLCLAKEDNISGLSAYGNNESEILQNSQLLFQDEVAINWMALNCTGHFMFKALGNSIFVNAMNASPYKTILLANEHWARFIAYL